MGNQENAMRTIDGRGYEKWWLWIIVGVFALSILAVLIYTNTSVDPDHRGKSTLQQDDNQQGGNTQNQTQPGQGSPNP